ncbi:LacI family DNA-binding transcriptional regulator [Paenibacillus sp. SYP-B4298]|uniref:LacI family DNA-binding transcriptional regulator n=1 Tax=Paenibacillus sp. SYP-B4298 TaxID=2996034 RepID=UPI0022DD6B99|nr:LacI family DNA-binding transcriptional regulator [Paenibacillus sp. SYP-B4298]
MQKTMTIQEVAKLAGVSVATVSRVMNGSPLVKSKTREKVLSVIDKFEYEPNLLGRDLRRSETMKVLVLTPNLDRSIFADIVRGIEARGQEAGYYVLVCPTSNAMEREQELFRMVKNRLVDGVIVFSSSLSGEELSALGQRYNIVQCCEVKEASHTCNVSIDDEKAAYEATCYLINEGHRSIGLIGGLPELHSTQLRLSGYRRALEQYQLPYADERILFGEGHHEDGARLAQALLKLPEPPTAIFCLSDLLAVGCVNAVRQLGRSIPEELSVIGFDNTREATMALPALTTVHQPKYDLGYSAMDQLIHNMTNTEKRYENVMLAHELLERESTRGGLVKADHPTGSAQG